MNLENQTATAEEIQAAKKLVEATRQKLGAFEYGPEPQSDTVRRIRKDTVTLDTGAQYTGEWDV